MTSQGKKRSVGFASSCVEEIGSGITVVRSTEDSKIFNVDIGFLKVNKRYAINFVLPNVFGSSKSLQCSSASVGIVLKDVHFRNGKLAVSLEYLCEFKEGIVYENFVLSSDETSDYLKVVLHMDILGKTQGTPSLKTGVKCVQSLTDCESDQSDWQGF